MDELLSLCSDTLIARLAGTTSSASPLRVRLQAARAIRAHVRELPRPYGDVLVYRHGLEGRSLTDSEIAARLQVATSEVGVLYGEALAELGWTLICGPNRSPAEAAALEAAA